MAKKKTGGRKKASKKKHSKKRTKKKAAKKKAAKKRTKKKAAKKRTKKKVAKKRGKKRTKKAAKKRTKKAAKKRTKKKGAKKAAKKKATKKRGKKRTKKAAKKRTKKKATKKVVKRGAAKPAKPKRRHPAWPAGTPRVKYTRDEAEGRLGHAGAKLSKSRSVGKRKRKGIRGLSADARRMQLSSQGYLQVNPHGNPVEPIAGYPGMYVVKPGKGDKVRSKAVAVRTGKRSKTKAGRGSVGKRTLSPKRQEELNRIRRAAGIPVRRK